MAVVAARVLKTHTTAHCAFLLLGSATTFVELGLKSGLYQGCNDSAHSVIKQLLALASDMFPPRTPIEALRFELSMLGGSVDRLRRLLFAAPKPSSQGRSYLCIADIRDSTADLLAGKPLQRRLIQGAP